MGKDVVKNLLELQAGLGLSGEFRCRRNVVEVQRPRGLDQTSVKLMEPLLDRTRPEQRIALGSGVINIKNFMIEIGQLRIKIKNGLLWCIARISYQERLCL